jgi:hypothetical protein
MKDDIKTSLDSNIHLRDFELVARRAAGMEPKRNFRRAATGILKKTALAVAVCLAVLVGGGIAIFQLYFNRIFSYELTEVVLRCSRGIEISDKAGDWSHLDAGEHLERDARIRTPSTGQSFLSFDGVRVLANGDAELRINGRREFSVENGDIIVASADRELPVTINLEEVLVRSNGSVLRVEQNEKSASVGVATGVAEITTGDGMTHKVIAGNKAILRRGMHTVDLVSAEVADPFARRKVPAIYRARQRFEQVIAKYLPNYRMTRQSGQNFRFADLIGQWDRPDEMYQFASFTPNTQHRLAGATSVDIDEYYDSLFAPSNRSIAIGRQSTVRLRPDCAPGTSAWSHDGSMLAFIETAANSPYTSVRVVRLDDLENPWDISQECVSALPFEELTWSPDNRHVLFMMTDNLEIYEDGGWDWNGPFKIVIAPIDPDEGPLRDFDSPFPDVPLTLPIPVGRTGSPQILKLPWGDAMLCGNWGNIGYIPVEHDGQSVAQAAGLTLTDFDPRKVFVMGAQWSPSASMIMFTAVENLYFGIFKTYILYGVEDILDGFSDPPQSLGDPRVRWVAPTDNFQIRGGFSYDESLAFFQEDVNQAFDVRTPTRLNNSDFDLLYTSALPEQESEIVQIHVAGSQLFLRPSPEGNRLAYSNYVEERERGHSAVKGELRVVSFDIEAEVDAELGGFLMDNSGSNLIVPPGTLEENFSIMITTPFAIGEEVELTEGDNTYFSMRLLDAQGLEKPLFVEPMTLTIRYTDDEVAGLDEDMLQVYYYDESDPANPVWIPMGGTVDPDYNEITVEIQHFSKYAVGGKMK